MVKRKQELCDLCWSEADRLIYFDDCHRACECCLEEMLDILRNRAPICVVDLCNRGWTVETVDGVKNCLVPPPNKNNPTPDHWVKVCGYTLPVVNGEILCTSD